MNKNCWNCQNHLNGKVTGSPCTLCINHSNWKNETIDALQDVLDEIMKAKSNLTQRTYYYMFGLETAESIVREVMKRYE